jgi:hypothetical protein
MGSRRIPRPDIDLGVNYKIVLRTPWWVRTSSSFWRTYGPNSAQMSAGKSSYGQMPRWQVAVATRSTAIA